MDVPVVQKTSRKTRKISRIRRGSCMTKHVQAKKKILPEDNKKDADGKHKTESGKGEKILLPKGKGVEVPENLHKSREKLIKSILSSNEAHSSSTCVLPKKTNPRILDIRKQLHLDTDLKSSVTCHALEYVEKNANKQSVSKELCATGNHGEKPAANEQVISVRSRSRTGENGPKRYFDLCETCHNINNKHYRREGNDVTNNSYVKSSKKAVNERKVWVQKSSSDSGK
ncbi:hypothetical protein SAY86_020285 [Trapa natans]|uniref:Uncharacterized protein n=1 Tax=Trapa natans TaxID=22666 RepID=A0AAN7LMD3_TRANT|nr:hypothetical protein SAY86_020285 [Trapa natans]